MSVPRLLCFMHALYLLDVCSMLAGRLLYVSSMSARCLLDHVGLNGVLVRIRRVRIQDQIQ